MPRESEQEHPVIRALRGTTKIVINCQHGGFSLNDRARELYKHYAMIPEDTGVFDFDISRDDPDLVRVVEELGEAANGLYAKLKIVEIPADVDWILEEYDGLEWIAERHRTWR